MKKTTSSEQAAVVVVTKSLVQQQITLFKECEMFSALKIDSWPNKVESSLIFPIGEYNINLHEEALEALYNLDGINDGAMIHDLAGSTFCKDSKTASSEIHFFKKDGGFVGQIFFRQILKDGKHAICNVTLVVETARENLNEVVEELAKMYFSDFDITESENIRIADTDVEK